MKKIVLLLLVAAFATSPATAASKHKKARPKQQESEFQKQSRNTMRILRDGAPLVLPTWSLPIYFGTGMDTTQKQKEAKKK